MKNNITANQIAKGLIAKLPRLRYVVVALDSDAVRYADPSATLDELAEIQLTEILAELCEPEVDDVDN